MDMDGNKSGSSNVSDSDVLADYMVAPTEMRMDMHMLGAMYAPTDWLTLATMIPLLDISMDHITRMGGAFKTESSGLGDISLSALLGIYNSGIHSLHLNTGLSFPTGDIDEKGDTPAAQNVQLPYPMQLGSGTYDLLPGITYLGNLSDFSWGAQILGRFHLGRNSNDYSLGDRYSGTAWLAYRMGNWSSVSFRSKYEIWENIDGADPLLNPLLVPTADPALRAGERLDLAFGINFVVPEGKMRDFRLAIEFILPVYQDLDGPQLETDYGLMIGSQYSF